MLSISQKLKRLNYSAIFLICVIASVGFAMLYSAADGHLMPWAGKQIIRFSVGIVIMLGVALVDIRTWMFLAYPFYVVSLILLICVELMGFIGMGAQRWIDLYLIQLQPSELMKIALILALARYFQLTSLAETKRFSRLLFPLLLIAIPTLLVMRQPDLGTAMILIMSGAILFFVTGVRLWKFIAAGGLVAAAVPILWTMLHEYQRKRVLIFLDPESDPSNSGYHVSQSKIALGSGGWFGKGYMNGTQSHLNFLPEKQTDFIFTMFSEEFGFVGGVVLVSLYVMLLAYGFFVALRARNHFGRLVAIGITSTMFLYAFINMAMVMGMLPVVGVPLPLVSYGGTAMLTLLMGQGLLLSVAIYHDVRIGR
ncbi:rod shape-determining protein RodA [Candidatus Paracaedibacter symbiosus]|uniref:rod shape-determining protein RodA n=1 Tax=Candidatus Paracaedibacter symbiosus TaxID=244582 RepID=UPI00050992BC|nr:rod shape-determining protein RodA [Candidatus Paracaedibacter symbiosus]